MSAARSWRPTSSRSIRVGNRTVLVEHPSETSCRLEVLGSAFERKETTEFLAAVEAMLGPEASARLIVDLRQMDGIIPDTAWRPLKNLCDRNMVRVGILVSAVQLGRDTQLQMASMAWGPDFGVFHTDAGADAWAAGGRVSWLPGTGLPRAGLRG